MKLDDLSYLGDRPCAARAGHASTPSHGLYPWEGIGNHTWLNSSSRIILAFELCESLLAGGHEEFRTRLTFGPAGVHHREAYTIHQSLGLGFQVSLRRFPSGCLSTPIEVSIRGHEPTISRSPLPVVLQQSRGLPAL